MAKTKTRNFLEGQFVVSKAQSFTKELKSIEIYKIIKIEAKFIKLEYYSVCISKNKKLSLAPVILESVTVVAGEEVVKSQTLSPRVAKSLVEKEYTLLQDFLFERVKFLEQERERTAKLSELISSEEMKDEEVEVSVI